MAESTNNSGIALADDQEKLEKLIAWLEELQMRQDHELKIRNDADTNDMLDELEGDAELKQMAANKKGRKQHKDGIIASLVTKKREEKLIERIVAAHHNQHIRDSGGQGGMGH